MSDMLRITGFASGLDTDTMVKQMMKPYNMRVDKMKQDRQVLQWKQDIYREMLSQMNTFQSSYFDVLKPENYMLSASRYNTFDTTYPVTGDSTIATAVGGAGAINGTYTLKDITLAKSASTSTAATSDITKQAANAISVKPVITAGGNDKVTINGKEITLTAKTYDSMSALASEINSKLKDANIDNVLAQVSTDGTGIKFSPLQKIAEDQDIKFSISGKDYSVKLSAGTYTMEQIADNINKQIGNIKDGTTGEKLLVDKIQAKAVFDGTNAKLQFEKLSSSAADISITNGAAAPITLTGTDTKDAGFSWSSSAIKVEGNTNVAAGSDTMKFKIKIDDSNKTLTFKVGATTKSITLDVGDYDLGNDTSGLIKEINDKIATDADLNLKVKAQLSLDGSRIQFINTTKDGTQVSLSGSAASTLGFSSSTTGIYASGYDKMSSLVNGPISFTINGKTVHYNFSGADKDRTINDILNDISASTGVKASYSEIGRKFTLETSNTGSDQQLKVTWDDTNTTSKNFLSNIFGISGAGSFSQSGSDATATIKDPKGNSATVTQSKNTFSIDGVTYNLLSETHSDPAKEISITFTQNTQKAFDKIKDFVGKYNELVSKISSKITEKRDINYKPLTDDQKKDMKEEQIKQWEDKAKQGLLRNDSDLQSMLYSLRNAIFQSVDGVGISLSDIGIESSPDYMSGGQLTIDETKLKNALANNSDQVAQLFAKTSTSSPIYSSSLTSTERATRNSEEGILQRVNDIFKDYTRTIDGKGILIQKAGITGDRTDVKNIISDQLKEKDKVIKDMISKLSDREDRYYKQFAKLEQAMNQMNAQQSWLAQQLGSGK